MGLINYIKVSGAQPAVAAVVFNADPGSAVVGFALRNALDRFARVDCAHKRIIAGCRDFGSDIDVAERFILGIDSVIVAQNNIEVC